MRDAFVPVALCLLPLLGSACAGDVRAVGRATPRPAQASGPVSDPAPVSPTPSGPAPESPSEPPNAPTPTPDTPMREPTPDGSPDESIPGAIIGWAAVAGDGLETTTGGEGGERVTVTTADELIAAAKSDEPLTIA